MTRNTASGRLDSTGKQYGPSPYWGEPHHYIQASDLSDEIVEYHGEGNSPDEIAAELGVSVASVRRVLEAAR